MRLVTIPTARDFGCSRDGGTRMHYGTDLKAPDGTVLRAMYGGIVTDIIDTVPNYSYTAGSLGDYIIIESIINGTTTAFKFCHLS